MMTLPGVSELGANPSNKLITGTAAEGEGDCIDREESDDSFSNVLSGILPSSLLNKMSGVDWLLCTGGNVPIDRRSNRTSVPDFGA